MLSEFITVNRDVIIAKTREKLKGRGRPSASADDLMNGVPIFLTQLSETLRWEQTSTPYSATAIGSAATRHAGELLALGFTVSEVVHDYGDICQAITELAVAKGARITAEEVHTLNRCLDTAIAEAVTEHARRTAEASAREEVERLGQVAHEVRDTVSLALLAFRTLQLGTVGINGSTGTMLGKSLMRLRDFVDTILTDVRMGASQQRRERIMVTSFLTDIVLAGGLHAEYRGMNFTVDPVDPSWFVEGDPQLLATAVMNLLNNAFQYSHAGGRVTMRTRDENGLLYIEVEDECGGFPEVIADPFKPFGERRGHDRTGLGLGLSIARKAVKAHGGGIQIRNIPGRGCIFAVELPLASHSQPAQAVNA